MNPDIKICINLAMAIDRPDIFLILGLVIALLFVFHGSEYQNQFIFWNEAFESLYMTPAMIIGHLDHSWDKTQILSTIMHIRLEFFNFCSMILS